MTTNDERSILLHVQHAHEAERQAALVRHALADATDHGRIYGGPITAGGDRIRIRNVPISTLGVSGTQLGTDPMREVLRKERR